MVSTGPFVFQADVPPEMQPPKRHSAAYHFGRFVGYVVSMAIMVAVMAFAGTYAGVVAYKLAMAG